MEEVWLIQLDWPDMRKWPAHIYMTFAKDMNKYTFPRIHRQELKSQSVLLWVEDLGLKEHGLPNVAAVLKGPVALNSAHVTAYSYTNVYKSMRKKDTRYPAEVAQAFTETIHYRILSHKLDSEDRYVQAVRMPPAPIQTHGQTFTDEQALQFVLQRRIPTLITSINYVLRQHRHHILSDHPDWELYVQTALSLQHSFFRDFGEVPQPIPVEDIQRKFNSATRIDHSGQRAFFHLVQGVDARYLALAPSASTGCAVVQVASQFNFLEALTPAHNPIMGYFNDHTQGAQASLGSLAALMVRDHYFKGMADGDIQPLFCNLRPPQYQNGYLQLFEFDRDPHGLKELEAKINSFGGMLRILPQWGFPELGGGNAMLQVFTAAPSYQGARMPAEGSVGARICNMLVVSQYRAIAQLAVMLSLSLGRGRVPLHLTLVGQGFFQNPPSVLTDSLNAVHEVVDGYNVDVFVHGYSPYDIRLIKTAYPKASQYFFLDGGNFMVYHSQQPRIQVMQPLSQVTQPSSQAGQPSIRSQKLQLRGLFKGLGRMMQLGGGAK